MQITKLALALFSACILGHQVCAQQSGDGSIGDVHVMFAGVPKSIAAKGAPELQRQLHDALGINVVSAVDSSTARIISQ